MKFVWIVLSVFPFTRSAPSATVKQPDSPVNCDVTPHLDWFNWGPSCVVNVVEKQCFHTTHCFYFFLPLCNEPLFQFSAPSLDLLQHRCFSQLDFRLSTISLSSPGIFFPPLLSSAALEGKPATCYSVIIATISKQH